MDACNQIEKVNVKILPALAGRESLAAAKYGCSRWNSIGEKCGLYWAWYPDSCFVSLSLPSQKSSFVNCEYAAVVHKMLAQMFGCNELVQK